MAKRNGTAADVQRAVEEAQALADQHDELLSEREEVQRRLNEIDAQLNDIEGRSAKFVGVTRRRRKGKGKQKPKNKRATGPKPDDVLLMRALPTRAEAEEMDDGGATREELVAAAGEAGWETFSEKPDVVIGQALGRLKKSKFATRAGRGRWHLTAHGEKKREKMLAEAKEEEKEVEAA